MNNNHRIRFVVLACCVYSFSLYGQAAAGQKPLISASSTTQEIEDFTGAAFAVNTQLANVLFNQKDPFASSSINQQAIDTLYSALGVDAKTIEHTKICYFFMEYIVRLELAAKFLSWYETQKLGDVAALMVPLSNDAAWAQKQLEAWNQFAAQGKLRENIAQIAAVTNPDWMLLGQTVRPALSKLTWQQIAASDFWKSIPITDPKILVQSQFWQMYLEYTLATLFLRDKSLITSLTLSEKMIYPYIPTFQQSYYDENFTNIRYSSELHRTQLALTDAMRDRLLDQSTVWSATDLPKVWTQVQQFMQQPFYKLLAHATQNPVSLMNDIAQKKSAISTYLTQEEQQKLSADYPLIVEDLLCIGMIKNLQARTYDLFSKNKLDATIQTLRKIPTRPVPNILMFDFKEHAFLDDLNRAIDHFTSNAQLAKTQPKKLPPQFAQADISDERVVTTALWDDVKKEAGGFVDTFKNMGTKLAKQGAQWAGDAAEASSDMWGAGLDNARFMGYTILGDQKKAEDFQKKANAEFAAAQKKYEGVWKDTTDIVKTVGEDTGGAVLGFAAGELDVFLKAAGVNSNLKESTLGIWKSTIDTVIDNVALFLHLLIFVPFEVGTFVAFYGSQFIGVAVGSIINATVKSIEGDSSGWGILADEFKELGASMLTSFLSEVMFTVNQFLAVTTDVLMAAAYFAQLLAEITLDIYRGFANIAGSIAHLAGDEKTEQWFSDSTKTVEGYRSTIVAVANTAILIGATVATDGLAVGAIGMNTAFQVPQVVGAIQSDTQRIQDTKDERALVASFKTYVADSKEMSKKKKDDWLEEQNFKFVEEIDNQERGLGFYQDFINSYYDSIKENMSEQLGSTLAKNLTPQSQTATIPVQGADGQYKEEQVTYQFVPADVGSLFGFNTGVYNLNPSQGFALYSKGRDSFSQEIAVNPALMSEQGKPVIRKFWFLQKETIISDKQLQDIEVRFKAISLLDIFYIGLYCGGSPIDLKAIVKNGKADLDAAHLAKMCVFKREQLQGPINFDVYEHEGKGWYTGTIPTIPTPKLVTGTWYRIKINLQDTTLRVKVYQEGSSEPDWQTFTVAKTDQSTCGMISSGAAIEYQMIKPEPIITKISDKLRPKIERTVALQETFDRSTLHQTMYPQTLYPSTTNVFKLAALDKTEILKGNYMYTTQETKLAQELPQLKEDYVLVCEATAENQIQTAGIGNGAAQAELIGINPQERISLSGDKKIVISLVTDKQFESDGTWAIAAANNKVAYRPSLNAYLKAHPSVSDAARTQITNARELYNAQLLKPFNFGNITLNSSSKTDVDARIFVYTCTSPDKALRDANIQDYVVFAQLDQYNYPINFPLAHGVNFKINPDDATVPTLVIFSLVTGLWYKENSNTPVDPNNRYIVEVNNPNANTADLYTSFKQAGCTELLGKIERAQQAYKVPENVKTLQQSILKMLKTVTTQSTTFAQTHSGSGTVNPQQPDTKPAEKSVTEQQEEASTSGN